MSDDEDDGPPEKKPEAGAPLWMATFSDMMSLLLAFFVLLFSFSSMDDKKYAEIGGSLKDAFGAQRKLEVMERIKGINHIAKEYSASRPDMSILSVVPPTLIEDVMRFLTTQEPKTLVDEMSRKYGEGTAQTMLKLAEALKEIDSKVEALPNSQTTEDAKKKKEEIQQKELEAFKLVAQLAASQQASTESDASDSTSSSKPHAEVEDESQKMRDPSELETSDKKPGASVGASGPSEGGPDVDQESLSHKQDLDSLEFPDLAEESKEPRGVEEQPGNAQEKLEDLKDAFAEEIEYGLVEIEIENGKLIIRINEKGLFASGSAELLGNITPIISKVGTALRGVKGSISVAGHTDNVPINTSRYRSNWELSAARAVTVVHELVQETGLPENAFQVEGYGDTRPLTTNATASGRARNRRVEVIVLEEQLRQRTPKEKKRALLERKRGLSPSRTATEAKKEPAKLPPVDPTKAIPSIVPPLGIDLFGG